MAIPNNVFYTFVGILSLIFIGLVVLLIITTNSAKRIVPEAFNPYCLVTNCPGNEDPTFTQVEDGKYVTLNYCTLNAPKPDFIRAVQRCALNPGEERTYFQTRNRLKEYKDWYRGTFTDLCGREWDITNSHTSFVNDIDKCINA